MTRQGTGYFHSPSGNIGCFLIWYAAQRYVDCTVQQKDFADPPQPPGGCDAAWVPQFRLQRTATYGACRGDVDGMPTDRELAYGTAAVNGPIVCVSEQAGITCRNTTTHHGFALSRQSYQLF